MSHPQKDRPWLFRTYAGHSTAKASNTLYRANLAKGQTGLSVAFDLPTQTGYDSDHELSKGEVGKVGEVGFWPQAPKALGLFLATGFWFLVPGFWFLVPWLRANFRQIPKDNNSVRRWTAFR